MLVPSGHLELGLVASFVLAVTVIFAPVPEVGHSAEPFVVSPIAVPGLGRSLLVVHSPQPYVEPVSLDFHVSDLIEQAFPRQQRRHSSQPELGLPLAWA